MLRSGETRRAFVATILWLKLKPKLKSDHLNSEAFQMQLIVLPNLRIHKPQKNYTRQKPPARVNIATPMFTRALNDTYAEGVDGGGVDSVSARVWEYEQHEGMLSHPCYRNFTENLNPNLHYYLILTCDEVKLLAGAMKRYNAKFPFHSFGLLSVPESSFFVSNRKPCSLLA